MKTLVILVLDYLIGRYFIVPGLQTEDVLYYVGAAVLLLAVSIAILSCRK
jgi:hypothetical protein